MFTKLTVFFLAITLLWILLDTFRLRRDIVRFRKVKSGFREQPSMARSEIALLKALDNRKRFNFAFQLPSSNNWLYLAISHDGRQRRLHFGTSNVEPVGSAHVN